MMKVFGFAISGLLKSLLAHPWIIDLTRSCSAPLFLPSHVCHLRIADMLKRNEPKNLRIFDLRKKKFACPPIDNRFYKFPLCYFISAKSPSLSLIGLLPEIPSYCWSFRSEQVRKSWFFIPTLILRPLFITLNPFSIEESRAASKSPH